MMTEAEVETLLALPKVALSWSGWQPRANHAGHIVGVAELTDQAGVTIPGLTMQVEIKADLVARRCLFLLSVFQLHGKERRVVYQLEVAPGDKRTHNGLTPIYGPHEHVGPVVAAVNSPDVNCQEFASCLTWFFRRTGIAPIDVPDPFAS